jgi:hypothetical protein
MVGGNALHMFTIRSPRTLTHRRCSAAAQRLSRVRLRESYRPAARGRAVPVGAAVTYDARDMRTVRSMPWAIPSARTTYFHFKPSAWDSHLGCIDEAV